MENESNCREGNNANTALARLKNTYLTSFKCSDITDSV